MLRWCLHARDQTNLYSGCSELDRFDWRKNLENECSLKTMVGQNERRNCVVSLLMWYCGESSRKWLQE